MNQPSSLKLAFYEALTPFCLFPVDLTTSPMVRGNSLCGATTITQAVFRDFSFLRLSVWIYLTALKIVFKSDLIHSASYCMVPRTLLMNKRNTHKKKQHSLVHRSRNSPTCLRLLPREVRNRRRVRTHCSSMTNRRIIKTKPCTEKATRKRPTPGSDMEK